MENEIILELARKKLGEDITDIKRVINRGQVNETYILSTPSSKYVLRHDPNENTLDRFQKEAWCAEETSKRGVLTPLPIHTGIMQEHPYVIMPFIDGANGDETQNDKMIWEKLGEYASKIHSIPIEGYGDKMISPGIFNGSWEHFLSYNISSLNKEDKLLKSGILTIAQSQKLKGIFEGIRDTNFNFGLIHYDLSLNNTIITEDKNVYLLDWGSAEVNIVPHMDVEEILESSLKDSSEKFELFLKGYGMSQIDYEKIKPQIQSLSILTKVDKLRWALDRNPDRIQYYEDIVKRKLSTLTI